MQVLVVNGNDSGPLILFPQAVPMVNENLNY